MAKEIEAGKSPKPKTLKPKSRRAKRDSESKMVVDRIRLAADLRASLQVHEKETVEKLGALLTPHLADGERLELPALLRAMSRLIEDRVVRLSDSDEQHLFELDRDHAWRTSRRHWAAELRRRLVELRRIAGAIYGKTAAGAVLGIRGRTARDLVKLQRIGQRVVTRIADRKVTRPEPLPGCKPLDWEQWKAKVEEPLRELERAAKALAADHGETELALDRKRLEQESYDRHVHAAARWLMATYELIGFEQARKDLLPETRKRRRVARRPQATDPPQDAAAAPSGPAEGRDLAPAAEDARSGG